MNYVNSSTKNLSHGSSNLISHRRSNVNSFDNVSSFSLLPRTEQRRNRIIRPNRVMNPNLHLYRLRAISENIKSIFAREKKKDRLAPTRYASPRSTLYCDTLKKSIVQDDVSRWKCTVRPAQIF